MSQIITLPTVQDERGFLTIIEKVLPFQIKRIYYIYKVNSTNVRGGHRHKTNIQALICIAGSCRINLNNGTEKKSVILDNPNKCLVVEPEDWHTMDQFSEDAALLVLASEYYDASDYINRAYPNQGD